MTRALTPPEWTRDALCIEVGDYDLFFGEKGTNTTAAVRVCRKCPVVDDCRQYAIDHDELHGVWGATTPRQRLRIRTGGTA